MQLEVKQRGFSLIEVLLALSVLTLSAAGLAYMLFDSATALRYSYEHTIALGLAQEGVAAARMMADADFDLLTPGTHGLVLSSTTWNLSGNSDAQNGYTRQLTITDEDTDTKEVTSTVTWSVTPAREGSVNLHAQLVDYKNTGGLAGAIQVDSSGLGIGSSTLLGIQLTNTSQDPITIESLQFTWLPSETIYAITIELLPVYSTIPLLGAISGEVIDIADHTIPGGVTHTINVVTFSGTIAGSDMTMTLFTTDGSATHTYFDL